MWSELSESAACPVAEGGQVAALAARAIAGCTRANINVSLRARVELVHAVSMLFPPCLFRAGQVHTTYHVARLRHAISGPSAAGLNHQAMNQR